MEIQSKCFLDEFPETNTVYLTTRNYSYRKIKETIAEQDEEDKEQLSTGASMIYSSLSVQKNVFQNTAFLESRISVPEGIFQKSSFLTFAQQTKLSALMSSNYFGPSENQGELEKMLSLFDQKVESEAAEQLSLFLNKKVGRDRNPFQKGHGEESSELLCLNGIIAKNYQNFQILLSTNLGEKERSILLNMRLYLESEHPYECSLLRFSTNDKDLTEKYQTKINYKEMFCYFVLFYIIVLNSKSEVSDIVENWLFSFQKGGKKLASIFLFYEYMYLSCNKNIPAL